MKYFLLIFFICSTLHAQNIKILDITTDDADIEDVYLGLTKN